MQHSKKVSIIMPCFNSAEYVEESIYSVINQTHKDWELLIIDDGSSDESKDIVKMIQKKEPRIRLLDNRLSKGAAGARNYGLKVCDGRFVCFLDSDDLWKPEKLANQLSFILGNDVAFIYGDYIRFSENVKLGKVRAPSYVNFNKLTYYCPIGCLTVMLDREKIKEIIFPDCAKEDYALWLNILLNIDYAFNSGHCDCLYRVHNQSVSAKKYKELAKQYMVLKRTKKLNEFQSYIRVFVYAVRGLYIRLFEKLI